jgi:sugar phosphate isomerase/epimerase
MGADQAFSRRQLLATGGAAVAASMGLGSLASSAFADERLVPRRRIGIQLFTVRTLAEADLPATLALLAEIGYREIEVAGLFGRTPSQFRSLLDTNRLRAIGGHQLVGPALVPFFGARTVEDALNEAETLGQPYVGTAGITIPTGIVPGVGEPQTADRYRELAELANDWGAAAAARGLRLYLHVHYWEFGTDPQTGETLFQILLDETDPRLVWFEPDLFWMVFGGIDPLDWIPDYQHRFPLFHVKDGNPNPAGGYFNPGFTDLGEGSIDFRPIFQALKNKNAHHYIVERDDQPNPARTARVGYEYLRNLRAENRPRGGRGRRHGHGPSRLHDRGRSRPHS